MFARAAIQCDSDVVVIYASTQSEAQRIIMRQNVDVIVVDLEISGLDFAAFFRSVMMEVPRALVLATAQQSSVSDALCDEAMTEGAHDYFIKPINDSYNANYDKVKQKITALFANVPKGIKKKEKDFIKTSINNNIKNESIEVNPAVILIAASTGGPMALESILSGLPADFPVPVVIVQHMAMTFLNSLRNHLSQKSKLNIKIAEEGERIIAGTTYLAPGGIHTRLEKNGRIAFDDSPPINGIRPAADILFKSAAVSFAGRGVLAVILTGMGNDGAAGLEALKDKTNCYCIAQSESSSVVYGMPRAAAEAGLADNILDINDIVPKIINLKYDLR